MDEFIFYCPSYGRVHFLLSKFQIPSDIRKTQAMTREYHDSFQMAWKRFCSFSFNCKDIVREQFSKIFMCIIVYIYLMKPIFRNTDTLIFAIRVSLFCCLYGNFLWDQYVMSTQKYLKSIPRSISRASCILDRSVFVYYILRTYYFSCRCVTVLIEWLLRFMISE